MSCRRPDDGDGGGTALVVRKRIAAVLVVGAVASAVAAQEPPAFFTTDRSLEEMQAKQAVLDTSLGTIIIEFLPAAAPNHVGYFLDNAETGVYDGTIFHQVVKRGIVSGETRSRGIRRIATDTARAGSARSSRRSATRRTRGVRCRPRWCPASQTAPARSF